MGTCAVNRNRLSGIMLAALLPLIGGCAVKETAVKEVEALKVTSAGFVDSTDQVARKLATQYFQAVADYLDESLERRHAELRAEIYERTEQQMRNTIRAALEQLDNAMTGPIGRLNTALADARRAGDRSAEIDAALALSSTLAVLGREREGLSMQAVEKAAEQRQRALDALETAIEAARSDKRIDIDPEQEATMLLSAYAKATQNYRDTSGQAFDQLLRFARSVPFAKNAFVSGLKGDSLTALINELKTTDVSALIQARGQQLLQQGADHIREETNNLVGQIMERLGEPE